jgi:hypothetical protein
MLLQARCPHIPGVLTVLVDAHVLLLGQDGVVGLDAVLLEHSLIAITCELSSSLRLTCS